jgi:hypothetical protein
MEIPCVGSWSPSVRLSIREKEIIHKPCSYWKYPCHWNEYWKYPLEWIWNKLPPTTVSSSISFQFAHTSNFPFNSSGRFKGIFESDRRINYEGHFSGFGLGVSNFNLTLMTTGLILRLDSLDEWLALLWDENFVYFQWRRVVPYLINSWLLSPAWRRECVRAWIGRRKSLLSIWTELGKRRWHWALLSLQFLHEGGQNYTSGIDYT